MEIVDGLEVPRLHLFLECNSIESFELLQLLEFFDELFILFLSLFLHHLLQLLAPFLALLLPSLQFFGGGDLLWHPWSLNYVVLSVESWVCLLLLLFFVQPSDAASVGLEWLGRRLHPLLGGFVDWLVDLSI